MSDDLLYFHCPACGKPTSAPIGLSGSTTICSLCGKMIVVPGASQPPVLMPASAASFAPPVQSPKVPAKQATTPAPQIDISKIPGLSKRAVYKERRNSYTLGHRPGATFGHAFGGSFGLGFGCLLGLFAAFMVTVIALAVIGGLGASAARHAETPQQRGR